MGIERPKQLGVTLTEEEHKLIRELSVKKGMTMSAFIRMIIMELIEKEKGE